MLKLAIVDDEARIRQGIEKVIEQSGRAVHVVGSFSNGLHAHRFITEQSPDAVDVVMTDIMMPVMDGLKLIGKLRQERPSIAFVIISGFDDFEYARQGLKYGAVDYLMKPLNFDEIIQVLDRCGQATGADAAVAATLPVPGIQSGPAAGAPSESAESGGNRMVGGNRIAEQAKAIINRQYHRDISLQELADDVYVTPHYLSKLFRCEFGMTVTEYLIQVRIAKAKQLLEYHPEMKVFEVSYRTGYADAAYFNRLFKKMVGVTPKDYRNLQFSKCRG